MNLNKPKPSSQLFFQLVIVNLLMLLTAACSPPKEALFKEGEWYLNDQQQLALRFEGTGKGTFIKTNRAVASPKAFTYFQKGRRLKLKDQDKDLKKLRGKTTALGDTLLLRRFARPDIVLHTRKLNPWPQPPFRYRDDLASEVLKLEASYGQSPGYYTSLSIEDRLNIEYSEIILQVAENIRGNLRQSDQELKLDLWYPASDSLLRRPLVVLIHGGGFLAGDKADKLQVSLAQHLARKGFVVASLNYRMGFVFLPGAYSNLERAMYRGVQDVRAALRYLSMRAGDFRIDPDQVYIGGNSAGGFLSLMTAFMEQNEAWPSTRGNALKLQSDLGCLDCSGNSDQGDYTIKGVVNLWGALPDLDMMDAWENTHLLLIHGDDDKVVPFGYNYPFANVSSKLSSFFTSKVYGSAPIYGRATQLGIPVTLLPLHGMGHEPHIDQHLIMTAVYDTIEKSITRFIYRQVAPSLPLPSGPSSLKANDPVPVYSIPWSAAGRFSWNCDSCLVVSQENRSARVVWFDGSKNRTLQVAGFGPNGQVQQTLLQVKLE